jgi:hypothetical protein
MKTVLLTAALLLAGAAPAVAATTAPATDDTCLLHRYVQGWGAHGDHAMIVSDRFEHKYLVSLAGLCSDLDYSLAVGIVSPLGDTGDFCVDRGDKIIMRGGGVVPEPSACWVTKVERYTPEMEKAYKASLEAQHSQAN